jgi:isocitrate lyase
VLRSADQLVKERSRHPHSKDIKRAYSAADVARLRKSVPAAPALATPRAEKLRGNAHSIPHINALGATGYKLRSITHATFHTLDVSTFQLVKGQKDSRMTAYAALRQSEFAAEKDNYTATERQLEVGVEYLSARMAAAMAGTSSVSAMAGATVEPQFSTGPWRDAALGAAVASCENGGGSREIAPRRGVAKGGAGARPGAFDTAVDLRKEAA